MYYQQTNPSLIGEANWNERTCERRAGGNNILLTSLPDGMKVLPKGAPMFVNSSKQAVFIKTAKTTAAAAKNATAIKLEKGHPFKVGEKVNGSTISAIDATNEGYDELTIGALGTAVVSGEVVNSEITDASSVSLNYAPVVIKGTPSCTLTIQAYDIDEDTMPFPLSEEIKKDLTPRHSFLV